MNDEQSDRDEPAGGRSEPHRVRIPGFTAGTEVGLGDLIKRTTSLAGLRPCQPCAERATRLNHWMIFSGR